MSTVVLDEGLRARLNGFNAAVPVCEPDGRTVGHFLPEEMYRRLLYVWAEAELSTSEATQARLAALADFRAGRVKSTDEAIRELRSLESRP